MTLSQYITKIKRPRKHKIESPLSKVFKLLTASAIIISGFWTLFGFFSKSEQVSIAYNNLINEKKQILEKIMILEQKNNDLEKELERYKAGIDIKKLRQEKELAIEKNKSDQTLQLSKDRLSKETNETNFKIIQLKLKNEVKVAELERQSSFVSACVNAFLPGQEIKKVPNPNGFVGSVPKIAIKSAPQDGTMALEKCFQKYIELSKDENKLFINQK